MRNTGRTIALRILLTVVLSAALGFGVFKLLSNASSSKDQGSKTSQTSTSDRIPEDKPAPSKSKDTKNTKKPQTDKPATTPAMPPTTPPATTPGTTDSTAKQPAKPATPTAPAAPAGQNLANSGPGSVVALFMGTMIVGALLHNRFTANRSAEER